jgi:4-amino-4-deoxy-L-arabinose transferase-like glycosyltransferase
VNALDVKALARSAGRRLLVAAAVLSPLLWLTLPSRRLGQLPQRALVAAAAIALIATLVLRTRRARWTRDVPFVTLLLAAAVVRLYFAATQPYVHDEVNTAIPLARTISFTPGYIHLPLRGENHPALPAYVVKASGEFFGRTQTGYRMLSLLLGLGTIVLIYLLALDTVGPIGARWATALLAFNDYYLSVSARATAHVPHLLLVTGAMYAYGRFLQTQRARYVYAAAACAGLAFYAKEHSALLMPVFFIALLATSQRRWLRTPHPYLAAVLFAACIAPDLYYNVTTRSEVTVNYSGERVRVATYRDHLKRIGGLSLSPYPTMFYARPVAMAATRQLTGSEPTDFTPEYRTVNPLLGVMLIAGVILTAATRRARDDLQRFLLIQFAFVFLFFSLIQPGNPPGRLDAASWIWVETTILPAVVLTGGRLAELHGVARRVAWAGVAALLGWAVVATFR